MPGTLEETLRDALLRFIGDPPGNRPRHLSECTLVMGPTFSAEQVRATVNRLLDEDLVSAAPAWIVIAGETVMVLELQLKH